MNVLSPFILKTGRGKRIILDLLKCDLKMNVCEYGEMKIMLFGKEKMKCLSLIKCR